MRVLFLLDQPGVRDYRIYTGLKEAEPDWELRAIARFPNRGLLSQLAAPYSDLQFAFRGPSRKLWRLLNNLSSGRLLARTLSPYAKNVDWVYSHNMEMLGKAALHLRRSLPDLRLAHDFSDFFSIFPPDAHPVGFARTQIRLRWERELLEEADLVSFNSKEMARHAENSFRIGGSIAIVPNAYPEALAPEKLRPKLSGQDHLRRAVFVGHLNSEKVAPLRELARRGLEVHAFTYSADYLAGEEDRAIEFHPPLANKTLCEVISQYDYGFLPWVENPEELFYDYSLPGKLFDYLAAGLPVIVRPFPALVRFVNEWECGWVLAQWDDLDQLPPPATFLVDPRSWKISTYIGNLTAAMRR